MPPRKQDAKNRRNSAARRSLAFGSAIPARQSQRRAVPSAIGIVPQLSGMKLAMKRVTVAQAAPKPSPSRRSANPINMGFTNTNNSDTERQARSGRCRTRASGGGADSRGRTSGRPLRPNLIVVPARLAPSFMLGGAREVIVAIDRARARGEDEPRGEDRREDDGGRGREEEQLLDGAARRRLRWMVGELGFHRVRS